MCFIFQEDNKWKGRHFSLYPRSAQRVVDEFIGREEFESVPNLGFACLKGESHSKEKEQNVWQMGAIEAK